MEIKELQESKEKYRATINELLDENAKIIQNQDNLEQSLIKTEEELGQVKNQLLDQKHLLEKVKESELVIEENKQLKEKCINLEEEVSKDKILL